MQPQGQQPSSFNPDANPFEDLISAGAAGQQSPMAGMMAQMGGASGGQPSPQGGMPQTPKVGPDGMPMQPDALMPGKTGDNSRPLLGAISQLHQFIAGSTDPQEIAMIRQMVSMLTSLVQRDQSRSTQMMQDAIGGQQ